jgi:2-oxoisovalerate dehydrogenase E1 component
LSRLIASLLFNLQKKTGKVLIVHEDTLFHGFGAEIASQIAEFAFEYLDAPIRRLAAADTPIPFNSSLEEEMLPQTDTILTAIKKLSEY